MRNTYVVCAFVLLLGSGFRSAAGDTASSSSNRVVFDLRIAANRSLSELFVCRVRNESDRQIKVYGANPSPGRAFYLGWMDVAPEMREWVPLTHWLPTGMRSPSPDLFIEARSTQEWITEEPYGFFADMRESRYVVWKWQGSMVDPKPDLTLIPPPQIIIGFPAVDGRIAPLAVGRGEKKAVLHLALVVHAMKFFERKARDGGFTSMLPYEPPREIAFLLLNGTDTAITTDNPLTPQSAIIVRAPAINYRRELVLSNAVILKTAVAPGTHGEWRMPWQTVLDLIPPSDLEKIKAAGGDMDLVWKTGDLESAPLPMTFLPPTQDELDEAFLKKDANVPRIGENTKLSLNSLRLADMETTPVLIGKMRNEETNSVVADGVFRQYNHIESPYDRGYSYRFMRYGNVSGFFQIAARAEELFSIHVAQLIREVREREAGREVPSPIGLMINYRWNCVAQRTGNIWMAFPDKAEEISVVHAFDAARYDLPPGILDRGVSPPRANRPALPLIAPILAFVYNGDKPPELAFFLWNRTDIEIAASNPLTPKSRIIASAPAIKYTREISMPDVKAIERKIAPNTHTDWRLPWKTVIGLIPSDDLAKIKAAGGELDLTWKVGDWESPPLPVLLSKPEVSKPEKAK